MHPTKRIRLDYGKFNFIFWSINLSILLALLLCFLIPVNGAACGSDGWTHLNWLEQFSRLMREGYIYPRWLPDSFSGYGSAAFYFYPPLCYWTGTLLSFIIPFLSPGGIIYTLELGSSFLSVLTMRYFLRHLPVRPAAITISSLLYGFNGYRFLDIFFRNALAEQCALVFLPLVILSAEKALHPQKYTFSSIYILSTLSITAIVLTNIPAATLAIIACGIYFTVQERREYWKKILPLAFGVLTAGLLCSFYLLPMTALRPEAHFEHLFDQGAGFLNHQVPVSFLFSTTLLDFRIISVITVGSAVLSLFLIPRIRGKANQSMTNTLFFMTFFAIIVQVPYVGYFLHASIFPFKMLQFYWRWDMLLILVVPIIIAFALSRGQSIRLAFFISLLTITGTYAIGFFDFFSNHAQDLLHANHYDVYEYIPHDFKKWGPSLRIWLDSDSSKQPWIVPSVREIKKRDSYEYTIISDNNSATRYTLHQFYWKHWRLRDEHGTEIATNPDSTGKTTFLLPPGIQTYTYMLETSPAEKYGALLSSFGIVFFFSIAGISLIRRNRAPKNSS